MMQTNQLPLFDLWAPVEVLRFSYAIQADDEPFKLYNNYTALYARLLMPQEPALDGFSEVRRRTADPAHVVASQEFRRWMTA